MEMQLGNAAFVAITTLAVFLTVGVAAKLTIRQIKWKWIGTWMMFGVAIAIIQVQGTASPKLTVHAPIPTVQAKEIKIERVDLIPHRSMDEWRKSTDDFDKEQDKRIKENQ